MAFTYQIRNQYALHFVTFTVRQWVDVFTRKCYAGILIESLKHCQKEKGLKIYAWVIMSNHCHLIISSDKVPLSDIIRDFKKFTSKQIYQAIEDNHVESRKNWLLWILKKDGVIWFWTNGYHGEEIYSNDFLTTKINYIHQNPVRARIVEKEEEYIYSSCGDFYGIRKGKIELDEI